MAMTQRWNGHTSVGTANYYSGERTCDYCTWTQFRLQVKSNVDTCTVLADTSVISMYFHEFVFP